MKVTKIEPVTKTKFKVYLEEQFAFVLYKGELSRFGLQEENDISEEKVVQIKNEIVTKRAKLRVLYLLNQMDRTEMQLRMKLKQDLYTDDIIEKAMSYAASFGYVSDEKFAKRFIENKKNSKSKKEIIMLLYQKGISHDIIEKAVDESYQEEETQNVIQRLLEKKHFIVEEATDKEKKRMFDYLLRRGFSYEDIRQVIQVSLWNA